MKKFLIIVVILVMAPVAYISGYGAYHGLDVPSGLAAISKNLLGDELHYGAGEPVSASSLSVKPAKVTWRGDIENESLEEASGLAASRRHEDVLYSINDSGNEPRLFALGTDGRDLGSSSIRYSGTHDFEDIASFEIDKIAYLLIADTGDNFYWRRSVTLLIVEEPDLETLATGMGLNVAWSIEFSYPDGYRDVEAVAVDEEKIYLISKRRVPVEVYELPLRPGKMPIVAKRIGTLTGIPQPTDRDLREDPEFGKFRSMPTAFDINGRHAIVFTYRDAYYFRRGRRESWAAALTKIPKRILLPDIYGLEAGSFDTRAQHLYVTGEREDGVRRTGLYRVQM